MPTQINASTAPAPSAGDYAQIDEFISVGALPQGKPGKPLVNESQDFDPQKYPSRFIKKQWANSVASAIASGVPRLRGFPSRTTKPNI